ncbi:MAG: DUF1109 family protein, partial [Pseudomonadota bacterium]|nr:DUF1109 family protein [Pseudomonadota bacterium]
MDTNAFISQLAAKGAQKPMQRPLLVAGKWLLLLAAYFAVVTMFTGFRPDIAAKWQQPLYLIELAAMLTTAITAAVAASFLALPDVGQRPWIRFVPFVPLMFLGGLLLQNMANGNAMPLIECIRLQKYQCILLLILFSLLPGIF